MLSAAFCGCVVNKGSPSWERKDFSVSGKESETLRHIPAQESPECSPIETEKELELGLSKDTLWRKGLSASKNNFEGWPSSRRDHPHTATLPGREISKKALSGSHIYEIKWLTHSQIAYSEKGMRLLVPTTFFVPWQMSLGKITVIHVSSAWSVFQAHVHRCSLGHSALLWVFWRSF